MSAIALRLLAGFDRPRSDPSERPVEYTKSETVLVLVATVAFIGGLIHGESATGTARRRRAVDGFPIALDVALVDD
jgi:hypothetical protein